MATLSDLPYDQHRLTVVIALGFLLLGAIFRLPRIRVSSAEAGAFLVLVPLAVLVIVAGWASTEWAWAGESQVDNGFAPVAGLVCVLAWFSGIQLRNEELRSRSRVALLLPLALVSGVLWTRDAPPSHGAAYAAAALERRVPATGYACRRFATSDDVDYGLSDAQYQCDPGAGASCGKHTCSRWYIALDGKGRISEAVSPGGG